MNKYINYNLTQNLLNMIKRGKKEENTTIEKKFKKEKCPHSYYFT